ncbi:DUF7511 domain-containing protein [Halovenus sp. HT40]|uniref:DUF7511 domain-containing protein n=1 Tax=Halovenus sp. HT40 TaxID=3126691 RepID=UPI003FA5DA91
MPDSAASGNSEIKLASQVEQRRNQPDLCTIYQSNGDEMRKMSRWITAKGDAFIDLGSRR